MGTYYYLINDTRRECVEYDAYVKLSNVMYNEAVHMALVNYMLERQGDILRFVNDEENTPEEMYDYEEVDLRKYHYKDEEITRAIEAKILAIENHVET